ncbi:MAG: VWA domain-containing protein, partial [Leptospiraceae bacterium]|nr:VWA domain-containing protein [Leptospiraceae bacterium]
MKLSIEFIEYFLVIVPLGFLILFIYSKNQKALAWIEKNVAKRFQKNFTAYNSQTLKLQFLIFFLMSLLLVLALVNLQIEQQSEIDVKDKGMIFLIIDGSLSMLAGDTTKDSVSELRAYDRFEEAQNFASDLVDLFPEYKYGIITVSGDYVIHSMPSADSVEVKKIIRSLLAHNFENTGLILKPLLQELLRLSEILNQTFQVILISDGEQLPEQKEDINEELEALKRAGIVVHTVGVGTKAGGSVVFSIVWYDSCLLYTS